MLIFRKAIFYLKVSRPGLWFATIWLYLLPTSQSGELLNSFVFWYGLFYVCFPLNFMVYGWNDIVDYETDLLNPRKNNFWFGAKGSKSELRKLWVPIITVQILTIPLIFYYGRLNIIFIYLVFLLINWLYNLPEKGLRSKPPFELLCQIGYLLVVPFSIYLNKTTQLPWQTYLYLFLFSIQSHLMGEVMDIVPDKTSNRTTTAVKLGLKKTKLLIIFIVLAEIAILFTAFKEYIFGIFLIMVLLWLLLDLYLIFKNKTYTLLQMKWFAFASNFLGFVTIIYIWYSGCLLEIG